MGNLARDHRNRDLGVIHMARKYLESTIGMTEDDYQFILVRHGGLLCPQELASAKDLTHDGRQAVIAHLERMGFVRKSGKSTPKRPQRPTPSKDALPSVKKIRAQLISLGKLPDEYADGVAKQMLGADAPQFFEWCKLPDLRGIIQALAVQQKRMGVRTK